MDNFILENSTGNLYWKDLNGVYLGCNDEFANLIGLKKNSEIIGKNDWDLLSDRLDKKDIETIIKTDKEIIKSGVKKVVQEIGINHHGKKTLFFTKKIPIRDEKNKIIGIAGTSINISNYTNIKDEIIRYSVGNLYWKDTTGRYMGCNKSFADILNLSSPEDIVGKNDYDFFLESDFVKKIIEIDTQVIETGKEIITEEIGTGLGGKFAFYMTKKSPLLDNEGNIIGIIGTSIDITAEKQAQLSKQAFLENMSHDIRTPLAGICGLAEILSDYCDDEKISKSEMKEMAENIVESSQALMLLMNEVLKVSEIGYLPIKKGKFNIKKLVTEIVTLMSSEIKLKNIDVEVNCPDVLIKEDRFRVFRILINLIGNAVKFTESGSITVTCYTEELLKVEVEDTGIGIPKDKLDKIFDMFFKVTPSYKTGKFNGCGAGLYLSRQLAKEINGIITVESTINKGSKFTLYIR